MKELTAAQGLLRCGECDTIFDAMKSLSTTLPEERRFAPMGNAALTDVAEVAASNKLSTAGFEKGFFSKKEAQAATNKLSGQYTTLPTQGVYLAPVINHWYYLAGITVVIATDLQQPQLVSPVSVNSQPDTPIVLVIRVWDPLTTGLAED